MSLPTKAEDPQTTLGEYGWVRNRMARQLLKRAHNAAPSDGRSVAEKFEYNYGIRMGMLDSDLAERFILNVYDSSTYRFMTYCDEQTNRIMLLWLNACLQTCLRPFASVTTTNGLLSRGLMWVLSKEQFQEHLSRAGSRNPHTLLDIGAGDGNVTKELAACVTGPVYATEADGVMRFRLSRRGYRCLPEDGWESHGPYDVISCLNVLDRCDKPLSLLRQMRASLTPGSGRIIIAIVFPFRPFVEVGATRVRPTEAVVVPGASIEEHMQYFAYHIFPSAGLHVEAFSRVPYLCEGDMFEPYYLLHDAVFVLSACDPPNLSSFERAD